MEQKYIDRFWSRVDTSGDCWEWQRGCVADGYGVFWDGKKNRKAHKIAYELTYGPLQDGEIVRHTCDNPPCCNPVHLIKGTHADNMSDMVERKRAATGLRNGRYTKPESTARGKRHPRRLHPELWPKDRNYVHLHPESVQGEKNPRAKLDWTKVRCIRQRYATSPHTEETRRALASDFGMGLGTIAKIIYGKLWRE